MVHRRSTVPGLAWALLALLAATALAGDLHLAWTFAPGTSIRYRHTSTQETIQRLDGQTGDPMRTRQVETVEYRLSVVEADPATATSRVLCRYDAVAIELEQMLLGRVRWDSRRREDLARVDEPTVQPYARLVGQEFSFVLAPDGAVAEVRGHDKVRRAMLAGLDDSPFAKLAFEGAFGDEAVRGELERGFAVLPPGAITPGGTWARRLRRTIPLLGTVETRVESTLEKVEGDLAHITFKATLATVAPADPVADPVAARVEATLLAGSGAGRAVFSVRHGRLERSEAKVEMRLSSRLAPPVAPREGPGAAGSTSEVTQTVVVERVAE